MKKIIGWYRLLYIIGMTVVLLSALIIRQKMAPRKKRALARRYKRRWARQIMFILKIEVKIHGTVPQDLHGTIITPNHRSYLDIPAMLSVADCSMLSKYEVKHWPVIGTAAVAVGTIFVKRESKTSRSASLEAILRAVKNGLNVNIFPEGTTFRYPEIGPFKPGVYRLAVEQSLPVLPVRLEYDDKDYDWIGESSALQHFLKKPGFARTVIHLHFCPTVIPPPGTDGETFRDETVEIISRAMQM